MNTLFVDLVTFFMSLKYHEIPFFFLLSPVNYLHSLKDVPYIKTVGG